MSRPSRLCCGPQSKPAAHRCAIIGAPTDEDLFKPRRDVVVRSTEPGALPHIDREAARARAREIAREGVYSRALVQLDLPSPERSPKNPFDKAAKPDCRTAYAGLGLLAIPFLLASALADSGCRW